MYNTVSKGQDLTADVDDAIIEMAVAEAVDDHPKVHPPPPPQMIHQQIEELFLRSEEVDISLIKEPNGIYSQYRLRDVNQSRVSEMVDTLSANKSTRLNYQLTVMKVNNDYVLLDGNHRYRAVINLRKKNLDIFTKLPCTIYSRMSVQQALGMAFSNNRESEDVLAMTDYEKVAVIRNILAGNQSAKEEIIYDILGVYDASIQLRDLCVE